VYNVTKVYISDLKDHVMKTGQTMVKIQLLITEIITSATPSLSDVTENENRKWLKFSETKYWAGAWVDAYKYSCLASYV